MMRARLTANVLCLVLCLVMGTGCIANSIQSQARSIGGTKQRMNVTLLWGLKPTVVQATECRNGVAESVTFVPIWGVVVGWFTIGLILPTNTLYSCARGN